MKNLHALLRGAALAGAFVASAAANAQGGAPSAADHLKYRCIVLGELSACPWNRPAAKPAGDAVPGPYAQYLIDKGVARDEALNAAKAIGEAPVREAAPVAATTDREATRRQ
jgi:hypothetical protein